MSTNKLAYGKPEQGEGLWGRITSEVNPQKVRQERSACQSTSETSEKRESFWDEVRPVTAKERSRTRTQGESESEKILGRRNKKITFSLCSMMVWHTCA